ncbi:MAG: FUSC family protein [Gammaproteobacteria bacterium]
MIAILQSIRAVTAASLGFTLAYYLNWPQGYWIVLIAMLLSQVQVDDILLRNLLFVFICGISLVLNVYIANDITMNDVLLPLYLFLTTFASVYIGFLKSKFFLAAFIINIVGIISAGIPVSDEFLFFRVEGVLLGVVVGIVITILFVPTSQRSLIRQQFIETLMNMNELQKKTFFVYFKRDYTQKHFLYEKELHQLREKVLISLQRITQQQVGFDTLQHLFEITVTLGELRYRVKDSATFEVCEKEFQSVSDNMSRIFQQLIKKIRGKKIVDLSLEQFALAIESVETIYRSTLQVVSKEPLIFLIFIQDLFAMYDEFNSLSDKIEKI